MKILNSKGFTLIELLVVVSIIGVLASVVLSNLGKARDRARIAAAQSQMREIQKLVLLAQINENALLYQITGYACSECFCRDTQILSSNSACVDRWRLSIDRIAAAAGYASPENFYTDPWGQPYLLDENEGEFSSRCIPDMLGSAGPDRSQGRGFATNGTAGTAAADNISIQLLSSGC